MNITANPSAVWLAIAVCITIIAIIVGSKRGTTQSLIDGYLLLPECNSSTKIHSWGNWNDAEDNQDALDTIRRQSRVCTTCNVEQVRIVTTSEIENSVLKISEVNRTKDQA